MLKKRRGRAAPCLVIIAFSALVVVFVSMSVVTGEAMSRLDAPVARWVGDHASGAGRGWWELLTSLGSPPIVGVALLTVGLVDAVTHRRASVLVFVTVVGVGQYLAVSGIEILVDRPRPNPVAGVVVSLNAYPSGHSAAAAACWGAVALTLRPRWARWRLALAVAAMAAVAVAVSRVMLEVHWCTDVLAGLAIGWGWCALVVLAWPQRFAEIIEPTRALHVRARSQPRKDDQQRAGVDVTAEAHR